MQIDPALKRLLQLHVAVAGRDEEALRQCLRACALELEEKEQHRVIQALQETLDAQGTAFLMQIR